MESVVLLKQELRQTLTLRQKRRSSEQAQEAALAMPRLLKTFPPFVEANMVALYMAMESELPLDALFSLCWEQNKQTCIPYFDRNTRMYHLTEITEDTAFQIGHFGIREPLKRVDVAMQQVDLCMVPGMAFDRQGRRLGRGGGYYDRLLQDWNGTAVGVAYTDQLHPVIPIEAHDRMMQALVTENELINVS